MHAEQIVPTVCTCTTKFIGTTDTGYDDIISQRSLLLGPLLVKIV